MLLSCPSNQHTMHIAQHGINDSILCETVVKSVPRFAHGNTVHLPSWERCTTCLSVAAATESHYK